jgi:hypothetical protein
MGADNACFFVYPRFLIGCRYNTYLKIERNLFPPFGFPKCECRKVCKESDWLTAKGFTLLPSAANIWHFVLRRVSIAPSIRVASVSILLALLIVCVAARRTCASVGVVLNESLDESMDRITGTGHTAVYFSNICADSPVRLRLCRPGELGSVMSTYINIGEDQPYGWNVVPLSIYLYGVENPDNRPIFGSAKIKHLLEERYRDKYLSEYCTTEACRTSNKSEWREMVGATLIRGVYIFAIDTTATQDRQFIKEFNAVANKNHFNGVTRNCADFTRGVINSYFPHAVNRDYINDFGMTSPKAVARTFTHYAMSHPQANFRVLHFPQVPGTIKRSSEVRAGTEQLYHSKKFLIPMILFADHELPVVVASYVLTGRFNPERTFEKYPAVEANAESATPPLVQQVAATPEERLQVVGTSREWKQYRKTFDSFVDENNSVLGPHDLNRFFKHLDREGTPSVDSNGSVWIELEENGESLNVGVSENNVLAPGSNPQLACTVLLARAGWVVKSPKHRRETMLEFKQDWVTLEHASAEMNTNSNVHAAIANSAHTRLKARVAGEDLAQLP